MIRISQRSGQKMGRVAVSILTAGGMAASLLVLGATSSQAAPVEAGVSSATVSSAVSVPRKRFRPNSKFKVKDSDFGIHSYADSPAIPAGSIRLACAPSWRKSNPAPGKFNWDAFDASLAKTESWGNREVTYSFCGTPSWAGRPVANPSAEIMGPQSTSYPTKISYWKQFVTAVVKRYRGRIKNYQIWNEATSPQFFQGTPEQMAKLTKVASKIIRKYDKSARVLSASVQTHRSEWFQAFFPRYAKALKKHRWPIDVLTGHFYPAGKGDPKKRVATIKMFNKAASKAKVPSRIERWDTEVNYWTGVPGNPSQGRIAGKKAAGYLAQTFLDSWRMGLRQTYWYMWTHQYEAFLGIQMRGSQDAATHAYRTLAAWTVGAKFKGCAQKGKLVKCEFKKGSKFQIVYTQKGKAKFKFKGKKTICAVDGSACSSAKKRIKAKQLPVRVS